MPVMWNQFWGEGMTIEAHRTLKSYCIGEQCKQFFASFYLVGNSCSLQHLFDTTFSLFALLFFLLISPIFNFYYLLMHWSTFVREWCLLSKNGQQLVNQSPYTEVQRCALLCAHRMRQKKLNPPERKVVLGCLQIWRQSYSLRISKDWY